MSYMKIRCRNDGAVLTIVYKPGVETAFVTCPVCKRRMQVKQFQTVTSQLSADTSDITKVESLDGRYHSVGVLVDKSTGATYALKQGRNIIGRKSKTVQPTAGIQLVCPDNRTSREHLVIEVEGDGEHGYVHHVSLYKKEVNATYVGQLRLGHSDRVILQDGSEIRLPDVCLTFKIPPK